MNVTYIYAHLVVLLGFNTFRESHGLGLYSAIRIKHAYGLHTCIGRHNLWETAIGIVLKLLNSNTTTKAATIWQFTCMVEEIAMTFIIGHTTVVSKRVGITQRHNLASILPGTCWRRCRTIRDMLGHTTSSIQQLIGAVTFGNPRSLYVTIFIGFTLFAFLHHRTAKSLFGHGQLTHLTVVRYHVTVQLQIVALWITPHQPCLTIVINHHGWIDMIPTAVLKQWFSECIFKWPCWTIAHSHTYGHTIRNL